MTKILETRTYELWENERQELFLKQKNEKEFIAQFSGDFKTFLREMMVKILFVFHVKQCVI